MSMPTLEDIEQHLRAVRRGLRKVGVPQSLLNSIKTRALKTGRRQTGPHQGNRANRWDVNSDDPQYGSESACKIILLRLYAMMMEFRNAPDADESTKGILESYLGRPIQKGVYRDPLTKERLDYSKFVAETQHPQHGKSEFHIGHENPKASPKHTQANASWRAARSNLIQGDLTLAEARTKFVELIARYFDLGEVKIEPE